MSGFCHLEERCMSGLFDVFLFILSCSCVRTYVCYLVAQAITKFESLANQVQKNAEDIQERMVLLETVRLFKQPPPKPGGDLPEAKVR